MNLRIVQLLLVALVLATGVQLPAGAQTAEQLEIFRNLSPEQQRAVLEQMNDGGSTSTSSRRVEFPSTSEAKTSAAEDLVEAEPRFRGRDSLLLRVDIRPLAADAPVRDPATERGLRELHTRMLAGNPYQLDRAGMLALPGMPPIALAGLDAEQAEQRLNSDPALRDFLLEVTLLPVEPTLKPFGYDLFANVPTTFAPATDIPVPAEYVVGPGDTFEVLLVGERGGRHTLTVGRDGSVDFPQLGPIAVTGLRFDSAKDLLEQRVAEQLIGMRANVSMGALRSIQVFVLGEAVQPGSYTVSGLSTVTHALFASGGVKPIGSLRNIQLKRSGVLVRTLDLYDLLLNGDTSGDVRLLPGDVIFIPPVGITAAISGEIQRPAIYEVKEGAAASEILYLAGGLTPQADPRAAVLERIDERRNRIVLDVDLTTPQGRGIRLQTGDSIRIRPIRDSLEAAVALEGHVHRPGNVQFRVGMRLSDLIGSLDELRPQADLHYVLVRREDAVGRRVSVVSADLAAAFASRGSAADLPLQARDRVYVFDLASSRDRVIEPIIRELDRQSGREQPRQVVSIGGRVKVPGQYPLERGMTVRDLIRAGGMLDQAAYGQFAELARYEVIDNARRQTDVMEIDLERALAGEAGANILLQPFDYLIVREVQGWGEQEFVTLVGEVRFPGTYPIRRDETLRAVIERAGGLTELAFPQGSVFTRRELRDREQRQLQVLAERLRRELATLSLQQAQASDDTGAAQAIAAGRGLLADLESTQAVGRLVIELDRIVSADNGLEGDVLVKDGDRLVVPRRTQEVTVIGEVQSATSHLYQTSLSRDDYIGRSGGFTQRADQRRIFVIRANGQVDAASGSRWMNRGSAQPIQPGDTVVVPLDAAQVRPLTLWTSVSQILFNIAVAVAAVNSF